MEVVEFEVEGEAIVVQPPSKEVLRKVNLAYKRGLQSALAKGAVKQSKAQRLIDEIWGPTEQTEFERLVALIQTDEALLTAGDLPVEEGRTVAERLRRNRADYWRHRGPWDAIDRSTAEDHANRVRFDTLVALCTYRKGGGRYFADVKAFVTLREQGNPVAAKAHWAVAGSLLGIREDYTDTLPENVFFRQHGSPAQVA